MAVAPQEIAPGVWTWRTRRYGWDDERDPRAWSRHYGFVGDEALVLVDPARVNARTGFDDWLDRVLPGRTLHVVMTDPTDRWATGEWLCAAHEGTIWGTGATGRLLDDPALLRRWDPGEPGPGGCLAFAAGPSGERALWIAARRVLVAGALVIRHPEDGPLHLPLGDVGRDPRAAAWMREQLRAPLTALTSLPAELLLLAHGAPLRGDVGPAMRAAMLAAGVSVDR